MAAGPFFLCLNTKSVGAGWATHFKRPISTLPGMPGEVEVEGWVNSVRRLGGIIFVEVVDGVSLQLYTLVVKRQLSEDMWQHVYGLKTGSAVKVRGVIPQQPISKRGVEVHPLEIKLVAAPLENLPIDTSEKTPVLLDTLLNNRYVALRMPSQRAIFRVRAAVARAAREFLEAEGFLEVNTPKICGAGAEGGATLFELDYFGRRAFLAQSPQLYKQMLMCGVSRVYEITPYFRAEKFSTIRHLNESWGIDVEMGFIEGPEDVMNLLENLIVHIFERVRFECGKELEALNTTLRIPRRPFKRLSYREALEVLEARGVKCTWGMDLGGDEERMIGEAMQAEGYDAYFIVEYPWDAKPFYIMREGELSRAFDLDYRGLELASGGQREHRVDELRRNILAKNLNPDSLEFYLAAFKYGMPPHGGFGLGLDRLVMSILGLKNIREAVLFPRDRERLVP